MSSIPVIPLAEPGAASSKIKRYKSDAKWRKLAGYFHRGTNYLSPYRGLICLVILLVTLVFTLILTCCWFCLFYNVQVSMPRTFAWELIVQLMGSHFDDCIEPFSGFPVDSVPIQQCRYTATSPWIPLVGAFICLVTFCTVTSFWVHRFIQIRRERVLPIQTVSWKVVLILMCILECMHFAVGIWNKYNSVIAAEQLRQRMEVTMNRFPNQLPHEIYYRWHVTQTKMKCCGMDGSSDWKFSVFRDGNPRYPLSCCNTDVLRLPFDVIKPHHPICKQTRREVWRKGCFMVEFETFKNYQKCFSQLLVLSCAIVNILSLFAWLLEKCLVTAPLFPPGTDFKVLSYFREKKSLPPRSRTATKVNPPVYNKSEKDCHGNDLILYDNEPRSKAAESHITSGSFDEKSDKNKCVCIEVHETKSHDIIIKSGNQLDDNDIKPIYTKKFKIFGDNPSSCATSEKSSVSGKETWV